MTINAFTKSSFHISHFAFCARPSFASAKSSPHCTKPLKLGLLVTGQIVPLTSPKLSNVPKCLSRLPILEIERLLWMESYIRAIHLSLFLFSVAIVLYSPRSIYSIKALPPGHTLIKPTNLQAFLEDLSRWHQLLRIQLMESSLLSTLIPILPSGNGKTAYCCISYSAPLYFRVQR